MDKEQFIENFAGLFEDTDTSNFTLDTDFRDNDEWSSILGLECMAMIKMEYEVNLRGEDIMNSKTIGRSLIIRTRYSEPSNHPALDVR